MKYIYKKKYPTSLFETIFLTVLCPLLVIQSVYIKSSKSAVLFSKITLTVSSLCIVLLLVYQIKFTCMIFSSKYKKCQRSKLSEQLINSSYLILLTIFLICVLSYFIPMGSWHSILNAGSVLMLLLYKTIYFDNIVFLTNEFMYTGFNRLCYAEIVNIKKVQRKINNKKFGLDDVIVFEFITKDGFKGYDTMFETDYNLLLSSMYNNLS